MTLRAFHALRDFRAAGATRPVLATATLLAALVAPAVSQAAAVCIVAPYVEGGNAASGCVDDSGFQGDGGVVRTGDWGVAVDVSGEYRGGSWRNVQSADMATGVLRSSLLYASGAEDRSEYLLNNYLDVYDGITFSGSGSAVFQMRLTGAFLGSPHRWYPNMMDTALDLYSETRGDDVLGRIHLAYETGELARFTSGSSCGWAFGLGRVECVVNSLDAGDIDITMSVFVDGITDGERFQFGSRLNLQAYGPRDGGVEFGNTARLSVLLSDGLGFASDSGVLLSGGPTAAVPLPSGALLAGLGLAAVAATRRKVS